MKVFSLLQLKMSDNSSIYDSSIWISFIFLLIIIILITGSGCCGVYHKQISHFVNTSNVPPMYKDYNNQLDYLKTKGLGKTTGVLSYNPNGNKPCSTGNNLLIQRNVTFKPNKYKQGCTFIEKRWPG